MRFLDLTYSLALLMALSLVSGPIKNRWARDARLGVNQSGFLGQTLIDHQPNTIREDCKRLPLS
jgi:hypothetical protein